jgi:acetyl-CoA carboxylase alpha subunit
MQENAIYSVISPEGCAAILWRDAKQARKAAYAFRPTARACLDLGVIDEIVPEPSGGAHRDHDRSARLLDEAIRTALAEAEAEPVQERRRTRRAKFRAMGVWGIAEAD